ncbi:MAG TPA: hypothetical protein VFJ94_03550 [Intrasporangium sp.]|uniref:hypothetical protein n=1 Tax=Intrasporangium sp. TaxID=1925024 RepID=UPI002D79E4FD|nr:hypothetical protein [Intrasporangium sp.]HET7397577.1 hypothetical protein [Intrasporangium sp.]
MTLSSLASPSGRRAPGGRARAALRVVLLVGALATAQAVGTALLVRAARSGADPATVGGPVPWLLEAALGIPVCTLVVVLACTAARRLSARRGGAAAVVYASLAGAVGQALATLHAHLAHHMLLVVTLPPVPAALRAVPARLPAPAAATTAAAAGHGHGGHGGQPVQAAETLVTSGGNVPGTATWAHLGNALPDAALTLAAAFLLLVTLGAVRTMLGAQRQSPVSRPWAGTRSAAPRRRLTGVVLCTGLVSSSLALGAVPAASAATAASTATCTSQTAQRRYDVVAISVAIPYNRWGDVVPSGLMYALRQDRAAYENWSRPLAADPTADPAGNRRLRPRPLVLRANAGECIEVKLTNEIFGGGEETGVPDGRVSMHANGVAYDAQDGDGGSVGFNDDTTVGPGQSTTMLWTAPGKEGMFLIEDRGVPIEGEADGGAKSQGLFGALVVEPSGSVWTDPTSGAPLYTGTSGQSGELYIAADIKPPTGNAFREAVQIAQDEIPSVGFGFNYGSEPARNRSGAGRCGDCIGEETSLSSWVYGDPALVKLASGPGPWLPTPGGDKEDCGLPESCYTSNVVHSYVGDPTKIRFALAGVKETHVFHMHAHQWLAEPHDVGTAGTNPTTPGAGKKPESTTIDSQTFGPGEAFTADLLFGSGSKSGTIGDSIFHCHLYPHFADGFWALYRTHDVYEDGTGRTPDGVGVRQLQTLPGRASLPAPTASNPGYPRFIPGVVGWRPPQPPGGVTEGGPSGAPAVRMAGGRPVDPDKVAVEAQVQQKRYGTAAPKPGAPLGDPCPPGARQVTYNVSAIQRDIVYNEAGEHDPQGRLLVLDKDVDAVLAGTKPAEPFFFRANAGDCINYNLTNRLPNWVGDDAFLKLQQTNLIAEHIHLVKFDVLGSDGSTNGWNYNQAAFTKDQADFNARLRAGTQSCTDTDCRLPDPTSWNPATAGAPMGQTLHERWYADYELRTVFTHDHHFAAVAQNRGFYGALVIEPAGFDARDPKTGRYLQPVNSTSHGTVCGSSCEGGAAGTAVDMIGPGTADDFRDFGLAVADFVSLTKKGGDSRTAAGTVNAPEVPEEFPDDDPGTMSVNYRNAPLRLRQTFNGTKVDPAYVFSSTTWGDPQTPILQAYSGDNVRTRLIQGSQEEQHVITIHGMRWRQEPDDPQSPYVSSQAVGVSDAFNFETPRVTCGSLEAEKRCRGDFIYTGSATDDVYEGMWGILRLHDKKQPNLLPLPDNVPTRSFTTALSSFGRVPRPSTLTLPLPAANPGNPCPSTAPKRTYSVVAMNRPLTYDAAGDNDPYGLMYVTAADEAAVRSGAKKAEPLTIRANAGDCVEVTLTNKLDKSFLGHGGTADGDPALPTESGSTPAGLRVSLHPQLLSYDVRGSDGATVGVNDDQTVAPGTSRKYLWYAASVPVGELGAANLLDYGDVRGHRHHGLFGGIVVEPAGSTWHDPVTGAQLGPFPAGTPNKAGAAADIRRSTGTSFREFGVYFQDGLNLRQADGTPIPDKPDHPPVPGEAPSLLDYEDRGQKGFNYRSAMLSHRMGPSLDPSLPDTLADRMAGVFSSQRHGDPDTPILRAYAGDQVRVRVLQGADKPRQHSFAVSGHSWMRQPGDPGSDLVGAQGGFSVGRALNVELNGGASSAAGDFRYGCLVGFHHQSGGLWGILRIYPRPPAGSAPTPLTGKDDPRAGGHPIQTLPGSV